MLPCTITAKRMKAIGRRITQIVDRPGAVQHAQLVERTVLDICGQLAAAQTIPDDLGFTAGEVEHAGYLRWFRK